MRKEDFYCEIQNQPAALERLLRVIRVKGYEILHFSAETTESHCAVHLRLQCPSHKPLLKPHLEKLQLVEHVFERSLDAISGNKWQEERTHALQSHDRCVETRI